MRRKEMYPGGFKKILTDSLHYGLRKEAMHALFSCVLFCFSVFQGELKSRKSHNILGKKKKKNTGFCIQRDLALSDYYLQSSDHEQNT